MNLTATLPPRLCLREVSERLNKSPSTARAICEREGYAWIDGRKLYSGNRMSRQTLAFRKRKLNALKNRPMEIAARIMRLSRMRTHGLYKMFGIDRTYQRERLVSKNELIEAQKPFHTKSVRRIAADLEVSPRTVMRYAKVYKVELKVKPRRES